MASKELNVVVQSRADTETNWNANSSVVPARGEVCVYFMTDGSTKLKVGDGTTTVGALPFLTAESGSAGGGGTEIILSPTEPQNQEVGSFWYKELS